MNSQVFFFFSCRAKSSGANVYSVGYDNDLCAFSTTIKPMTSHVSTPSQKPQNDDIWCCGFKKKIWNLAWVLDQTFTFIVQMSQFIKCICKPLPLVASICKVTHKRYDRKITWRFLICRVRKMERISGGVQLCSPLTHSPSQDCSTMEAREDPNLLTSCFSFLSPVTVRVAKHVHHISKMRSYSFVVLDQLSPFLVSPH